MNRLYVLRAVPRTPVDSDSLTTPAVPTVGQLLEQVADPNVDVETAVVVSIDAARVRRAVRTLPVREREVIAWRYGLTGQQLSCREVAQRLGVSAGTVVAMEQRALDRLRGLYGLPEAA